MFKKRPRLNHPKDPNNLLDVLENSSSRQVQHQKRSYSIAGVSLSSPTEVAKFCEANGINPKNLAIKPKILPGSGGKAEIRVDIEAKK